MRDSDISAWIKLMGECWQPYRHLSERLQINLARQFLANKEPQATFFGAVYFGIFGFTYWLLSLLPFSQSELTSNWLVILLVGVITIIFWYLFRAAALEFKISWPELWLEYVVFSAFIALWLGLLTWIMLLVPQAIWPGFNPTFIIELVIMVGEGFVAFIYLTMFSDIH